jgi:prefoldin beta subunit
MKKETEEKIGQLQLLEQNLQNLSSQKQNFQAQLLEIDNAMDELGKSKGKIYKIVGPVMISSEKKDLEKDLNSKKEIIELRVKNFEKQENKLREKFTETQEEVLKELKNKEG